MKRQLKLLLAMSAFAMLPVAAHAAGDFESAGFAFDGSALLDKVSVASVSASGTVLYCRADISAKGAAERVNCYSGETSDLVPATEEALASLPFSSASVEGTSVPVRMSFRVAYTPVDNAVRVSLIPNIGTMQAQYGRDYVAPQERLDVSDWYERYSNSSWAGGQEFLGEGNMSRVAATIRPNGKPAMLKTLEAKRAYQRDANVVKISLKDSRFIPGTVNGKVVTMDYMVAVHYSGGNQAYAKRK